MVKARGRKTAVYFCTELICLSVFRLTHEEKHTVDLNLRGISYSITETGKFDLVMFDCVFPVISRELLKKLKNI